MYARKILIAVPDRASANELGERLTKLAYVVAAIATKACEVADFATETQPDLVLLDAALGLDARGGRTIETFARLEKPPAVLFMTGIETAPALRRIGLADRTDRLVRPFTDLELRVNIDLALLRRTNVKLASEPEDRFFSLSLDMLCFLDFNGYFKRLNPAWERALGYKVDELKARRFVEFVHPDDRERTLNQNRDVRAGGRAVNFENRYLCKDGSFRWLRWNAAPDASERVIYSVARDVTESKQVDDERERLVRELQDALAEVRSLRSLLPVCSYCQKVRDDEDAWHTMESYIARHTHTKFSHGICPSCMETKVKPELDQVRHGRRRSGRMS